MLNKAVLFTGAGTGFGADAARVFYNAGGSVVLGRRRESALEKTGFGV